MAGRGPAPKHESVRARRNAPTANTLKLPSEGCKKRTPKWPLPADRSLTGSIIAAESRIEQLELEIVQCGDRELIGKLRVELRRTKANLVVARSDKRVAEAEEVKLWRTLWRLPQAEAWHEIGYLNEVAQYVRWKVRAELGEMQASKEARYLSSLIGLTPMAMLHLHWEISTDEVAAQREASGRPTQPPPGARKATPKKPDPRNALRAV